MRVRQKELRRIRKRREERLRLAAKGIAITGTGAAGSSASSTPRVNRPITRRSSETAPTPRPQGGNRDRRGDRGPRREGGQGGGERRERPQPENTTAAPAPTEG